MEEVARVYSRSLFQVGKEQGKLDELREQLGQFAQALEDNRELALFFFSPYFSTEEKCKGLHGAVSGADPALMNFLELLLENHRMPAIYRIRRQYEVLWLGENRLLAVEVTSAIELDEAIVRELGETIGKQTGRRVELSSSVDPGILGGIVVRVGNSILDASIRNRLEQLRRQIVSAA